MSKLATALQERQGDDSMRAVARDIGVAVGTVEGWLKSWRAPDWRHIPRIARYLGVDESQVVELILEDLPRNEGTGV